MAWWRRHGSNGDRASGVTRLPGACTRAHAATGGGGRGYRGRVSEERRAGEEKILAGWRQKRRGLGEEEN